MSSSFWRKSLPDDPAERVDVQGQLLEDDRLEEREDERGDDDAPDRAHAPQHDHDQHHHRHGEL